MILLIKLYASTTRRLPFISCLTLLSDHKKGFLQKYLRTPSVFSRLLNSLVHKSLSSETLTSHPDQYFPSFNKIPYHQQALHDICEVLQNHSHWLNEINLQINCNWTIRKTIHLPKPQIATDTRVKWGKDVWTVGSSERILFSFYDAFWFHDESYYCRELINVGSNTYANIRN